MGKKLYVGNLSYSVNDDSLQQHFSEFGAITSAKVMMDRDSGRSKGFGFVEMSSDAEAQAAISGMNGKSVDGRDMVVNEARPMEPRTGGFGGGGGGRREGGGGGGGGYGGGGGRDGGGGGYRGGGGGGYGGGGPGGASGGGYGGGGREGGGGGGGYRGAGPGGDGGPMRDRRADFSSAPPAPPAEGGDFGKPVRRFGGGAPDKPRRERDYEPRKRGFDDDQ